MIDDKQFIEVCKSSISMSQAAATLKLHFNTFKRRAIKLGCYETNQGGVGINKAMPPKVLLDDILEGRYPQFQTFKLKNRLLKTGLLKNQCSVCDIIDWNGKVLNMELDHIDGDRTNHRLENLRMLCPNCHAQTETYRAKNIK
jgi:5-methylcytosine-specific restriction endonuclease McrA